MSQLLVYSVLNWRTTRKLFSFCGRAETFYSHESGCTCLHC